MVRLRLAALALLFASPAAAQQCGTLTTCPFVSTPLAGTELLYIVQAGVSKKLTVTQLAADIGSLVPLAIGAPIAGGAAPNLLVQLAAGLQNGSLGAHLSLSSLGALSTDATGTGILATKGDVGVALPNLTTSQIYGGTGGAGVAQAFPLGTGLSAFLQQPPNATGGLVGYGGAFGNATGHASLDLPLTGGTLTGSLQYGFGGANPLILPTQWGGNPISNWSFATGGVYALNAGSGSTAIQQVSAWLDQSGTEHAYAGFFQARSTASGAAVWGIQDVAYASNSSSAAVGEEIDFGTDGVVGATAIGLALNVAGTSLSDTIIGLQFGTLGAGAVLTNAIQFTGSNTFANALLTSGSGVNPSHGIDFSLSTFTLDAWKSVGALIDKSGNVTGLTFSPTGSSVPTNGFYLPASNTLGLSANGGLALEIANTSTPVNFIEIEGANTGAAPALLVQGSDTNIGWNFTTKGTGTLGFFTENFARWQFAIADTPSAVDQVYVTGGVTGSPGTAVVGAQGTDSNVTLVLSPKGTGAVQNGGHITAVNTSPGISSCGTGSPAVVGSDNYLKITAGGGVLTSCVINFGKTWGTAPSCTVSSTTSLAAVTVTTSTTQLTIGATSLTSAVVNAVCGSLSELEPANDNFDVVAFREAA